MKQRAALWFPGSRVRFYKFVVHDDHRVMVHGTDGRGRGVDRMMDRPGARAFWTRCRGRGFLEIPWEEAPDNCWWLKRV